MKNMLNFIRFAQGYVCFEITGEFPERLINILSNNGITVFGLCRNGKSIYGKISVREYFMIKRFRKKCGVKTRVLERHGFPFLIKKYRNRIGFAAGFALSMAVLYFLSSMIWNVSVSGNEKINTKEILSACKELGIDEGKFISSIDARQAATELAIKIDGIAWCAVNIEGVRATVEVREDKMTEISENQPCNLKAARDGIIISTKVFNGTTEVRVGDAVTAGDILVSGVMEYTDGSVSFEHSKGEIYARTTRQLSYLATYIQTENLPAGKPIKKSVVDFFGVEIPLYLGSVKGIYNKKVSVHRYSDNGMYIPIYLTTAEFQPIKEYSFEVDSDTALKIATEHINSLEKEQMSGVEILSRNEKKEVRENGVKLTVDYICKENIAVQDLLLIYEGE